MKFIQIVSLCLLFVSISTAGGFDDLGYSARSVGMGGAGIAVHGTPYGLFYNPANIYSSKSLSFYTTYSNLFPGIEDDQISYGTASGIVPISFLGSLGTGITFLGSDLWKEYTLHGAYAKELFAGFTVGAAVKYLGWSAAAAEGESALSYSGFTVDAGLLYVLNDAIPNSQISIGLAAQNITEPSISSSGSSNNAKLPRKLGMGFAFYSTLYSYLLTVDLTKEEDVHWLKTGAEFLAYKGEILTLPVSLFARVGYYEIVKSNYSDANGLNGGFGLKVNDYTLDYAYHYPHLMEDLGGSHKISFSFNF
ncbi:MAG: hypothetical protein HYV28_04640 [Ignavibacteriales bacterium]|nr:hypothetical protein [Ignavibacteriales bacterium]